MAEAKPFWNRKTYCIITGASQGIGREIAVQFAKNVSEGSLFLLLARNLENLKETQRLMESVNSNVNVFVHSYNFYEPINVELHKILNQSMDMFQKSPEDFELSVVVHNAGTLGDVSELTYDMKNLEKLTNYFMLNFFSVCVLNAEFLKLFDPDKRAPDLPPMKSHGEICIVNITSLCAIKPFPSMGYYCTGKSCREMFFAVMAEENKNYLILNYSPGPVLTGMTDVITSNINNEEIRQMFVNMKENRTILTPPETVSKLVKVLDGRNFKSGSRIDYYEVKD
ncbi:UNVERIFIED_CONTAM: hypothetical protein PYX00_001991 [Menopon gallinae]|uniref:Sepiapterin reductase n=1 Tax=Menopon gallinae TaxID=328185 RepID=A0AAW2IEV8_9NEOP